jgi:hypothetical protein
MTDWDIQPRSSACNSCHKPFVDEQAYHTLLTLDAQGYRRRDLCPECFESAGRDGVISYWQGEYRLPVPPAAEPIQKETAETLLRKLVEDADPGKAGARYILAVMLERKRILKHRETVSQKVGADVLVYEHARTGESFTIPDPHLRLDQLQEVQAQIAMLLQPAAESAEAAPSQVAASGSSVKES